MAQFDQGLFDLINAWPDWLTPLFWFLSEATKITLGRVLLLSILLGLLILRQTRVQAIAALACAALSNEATDFIKATFPMHRPCFEHSVYLRVGELTSFGTASAHSANMAAVATVFTYYFGWSWKSVPWIVLAFLTGISRIYVGVHYPSQVLLGWSTGILISLFVVTIFDRIRLHFSKEEKLSPKQ